MNTNYNKTSGNIVAIDLSKFKSVACIYTAALGTADKAKGWRENKAFGGVLMDVPTNCILLEGLSMPHSPRWYRPASPGLQLMLMRRIQSAPARTATIRSTQPSWRLPCWRRMIPRQA
jgi:hypothetical protein